MKLVSMTLSGNNESIVSDALISVKGIVDLSILIDTGISDKTIDIARSIAGDKLVVKKYEWINNFADARNFALKCAAEESADWAIFVDTDERMLWNDEDLRTVLNDTDKNVLMMYSVDGSYCKERLFKIPAAEKYTGPTHETYPAYKVGFDSLTKARFLELPKSPEQYKKKFLRDVEILRKHVKSNPNDPRWFYYLGDTLKNLGQFEEAIQAFLKCWSINGWDEESAWACFKAAECAITMKQINRAIDILGFGFSRHPGIVELVWLSGWCWYQLGVYDKAEFCARMAITADCHGGFGNSVRRIGFRYALGQYDGPYDLLKWALQKQNKPVPLELDQQIHESRNARIEGMSGVKLSGSSGSARPA